MQNVPVEFGYPELAEAAIVAKHSVSKETLRSQMSGYKHAGIVESVSDGKFKLTDYGHEAAGASNKGAVASNENGATEVAPDVEGVAAPSVLNLTQEALSLIE